METTSRHLDTVFRKLAEQLIALGLPALVPPAEKLPREQGIRALKAQLDRIAFEAKAQEHFRHRPVDPDTFFRTPYFGASSLYPAVRDEVIELNQWSWSWEHGFIGKYEEAVFTGGIGSGKSTAALYSIMYQLYLLACIRNPHQLWHLDEDHEIMVVLQSVTSNLAKTVDYKRLRAMIEGSEWFREHFPFDPDFESEMHFPNRIIVRPLAGTDTSSLGQNVIGGLIDELNFMAMVKESKKTIDNVAYDQADALYNTIYTRRKTRFMKRGVMPFLLCLVSSRNYPGQFTDRKEEEAERNPRIFVYDKRVWEVKPPGDYSKRYFRVFIGDDMRKPRILRKGETVAKKDEGRVWCVPVDFRVSARNDIYKFLRDVVGVSTRASNPFLHDPEVLGRAFGKVRSVLSRGTADLCHQTVDIKADRFENLEAPRYGHVDLAETSDAAGFALGHVPYFKEVKLSEAASDWLPVIRFDVLLRIPPPTGGEIEFAAIRELIYKLRELGLPIRWISLDSYQSTDFRQIVRQQGIVTGKLSVDKTTMPYDMLKTALTEGRVEAPKHSHCRRELSMLQRVPKPTNRAESKIDHPPQGSKDLSDAMAAVIYGLTMRRETWIRHGMLAAMRRFAKRERAAQGLETEESEG